MARAASKLSLDFKLVHDEPEVAKIYSGGKQLAELRNVGVGLYKLVQGEKSWLLSRRVDDSLSPFSMLVSEFSEDGSKVEVLRVKDHLFLHGAYFYMVGGIPESQPPRNHLSGSKYIIRLTNFPHTSLEQIDEETLGRLKRHRGVPVGSIYGLGSQGFYVKIETELKIIGLQLAAATYLMYSSA